MRSTRLERCNSFLFLVQIGSPAILTICGLCTEIYPYQITLRNQRMLKKLMTIIFYISPEINIVCSNIFIIHLPLEISKHKKFLLIMGKTFKICQQHCFTWIDWAFSRYICGRKRYMRVIHPCATYGRKENVWFKPTQSRGIGNVVLKAWLAKTPLHSKAGITWSM